MHKLLQLTFKTGVMLTQPEMHPLFAVQRPKIIQKLHNFVMTIKFYVKAKTKFLVGKYTYKIILILLSQENSSSLFNISFKGCDTRT